jgi:hypothetical protein
LSNAARGQNKNQTASDHRSAALELRRPEGFQGVDALDRVVSPFEKAQGHALRRKIQD